jgi:hypothetical protein
VIKYGEVIWWHVLGWMRKCPNTYQHVGCSMFWTLQATGGKALSCNMMTPFTSISNASQVTQGPWTPALAVHWCQRRHLTSACGEDRCS